MYGNFILNENNKISGVKANNIQLANKIYYGSTKAELKCDNCNYHNLCLRGCLGAQYELNKDPLIACDDVCSLYRAKINFLIFKYEKMGIFKKLEEYIKKDLSNNYYNTNLLVQIREIQKGEEYKLWMNTLKKA